jgi:periplasmic protein CpxP/Spy
VEIDCFRKSEFDRDCLGFPTLAHESRQIISKEPPMKTILAALVAFAFLIGGAYAQRPSADASTAATMKSDAKRNTELERHIKDLHAKLKITPAEESQWVSVAQTMRDNANDLDKAIEKRQAIVSNGTAIDDLNAYGEIVQAHADAIKKLSAVFASLYASMSDDQKKVADEVFAQRAGKKIAMK